MPSADDLIRALNLQPLPGEGGFFRQTWMLPGRERPAGTAIMYLITPKSFSSLHRLDADEIFHFYGGDPCEQITIAPSGDLERVVLGTDVLQNQLPQHIVQKHSWQGTRLSSGGEWALIGTTMTPGYHQAGFELATVADLRSLPLDVAEIATGYLADGA